MPPMRNATMPSATIANTGKPRGNRRRLDSEMGCWEWAVSTSVMRELLSESRSSQSSDVGTSRLAVPNTMAEASDISYSRCAPPRPERRYCGRVNELRTIRAGLLDYQQAWQWQRQLHGQRVAGEIADTALLLEHPPVYTAGRRTEAWERPVDGAPVIDVDRGGKITWHGPGQLVGYPIVRLPD